MDFDKEKLEYLLDFFQYDISQLIEEAISKDRRSPYIAIEGWNLLWSYWSVSSYFQIGSSYTSLDQYFRLHQAPNARKKYKRFLKRMELEKETYEGTLFAGNQEAVPEEAGAEKQELKFDEEKFQYLMDRYINGLDGLNSLINEVLQDSWQDPHHSAVMATNCIICYMSSMGYLEKPLPFGDVKGYLLYYGFTEEQCREFERHRLRESAYYGGNQLVLTDAGEVEEFYYEFSSTEEIKALMKEAGLDPDHYDFG